MIGTVACARGVENSAMKLTTGAQTVRNATVAVRCAPLHMIGARTARNARSAARRNQVPTHGAIANAPNVERHAMRVTGGMAARAKDAVRGATKPMFGKAASVPSATKCATKATTGLRTASSVRRAARPDPKPTTGKRTVRSARSAACQTRNNYSNSVANACSMLPAVETLPKQFAFTDWPLFQGTQKQRTCWVCFWPRVEVISKSHTNGYARPPTKETKKPSKIAVA